MLKMHVGQVISTTNSQVVHRISDYLSDNFVWITFQRVVKDVYFQDTSRLFHKHLFQNFLSGCFNDGPVLLWVPVFSLRHYIYWIFNQDQRDMRHKLHPLRHQNGVWKVEIQIMHAWQTLLWVWWWSRNWDFSGYWLRGWV